MLTSFVLEVGNDGTRVTVTETGFEALPDERRQKRVDETTDGYERVLKGLKDHVEQAAS